MGFSVVAYPWMMVAAKMEPVRGRLEKSFLKGVPLQTLTAAEVTKGVGLDQYLKPEERHKWNQWSTELKFMECITLSLLTSTELPRTICLCYFKGLEPRHYLEYAAITSGNYGGRNCDVANEDLSRSIEVGLVLSGEKEIVRFSSLRCGIKRSDERHLASFYPSSSITRISRLYGRLEFSMGQTYGYDCTLSMCE